MATRKAGAAAPRKSVAKSNLSPATTADASGSVIEPEAAKLPDHPAVDRNPRAGTTVDQNRVDFNDPTKTDEEAVVANLKANG